MIDTLNAVIMAVCLNSFHWTAADLEQACTELSAYDQTLKDYADDFTNYERNVYDSANAQIELIKKHWEESDPPLLNDRIVFLTERANIEREFYQHAHWRAQCVRVNVENASICLRDIINRLNLMIEDAKNQEQEDQVFNQFMDFWEMIDREKSESNT